MNTEVYDKNEVVKLKLRELKEKWGLDWNDMGSILAIPASSLRVYASDGEHVPAIPDDRAERILGMSDVCPGLGDGPSGDLGIFLHGGRVYALDIPEIRFCRYCGKPFIPGHPQQIYCTTYAGECGLAMRRRRRNEP